MFFCGYRILICKEQTEAIMSNVLCEVCGKNCKGQRKRFCSMNCRSIGYMGESNPFFGKKQSDSQKDAVRNYNKNRNDYHLLSQKLKGRVISIESREKISRSLKEWYSHNPNPMQDKKHTEESKNKISQRTREQYLKSDLYEKRKSDRDTYRSYYYEVWRLTEQNDLSILKNNEKRSYRGYHLDHIFPIRKGFDNSVPPAEIARIENLQFLWWKDNIVKRTTIDTIPIHLKKYYETKDN